MLWITWNKLFVSVEYIASLAPACFWCLILFSPRQYPETRGYQSCGSLLHPRAQDLSLYARHWSGQSLLHLWSCLKHEEKNVYIYVLHDTTHTHARRLHSHCLENKVLIMLQEPLREFLQQTSIWRVWRFRKTHRVTSKHRFNRIWGGGGFLYKKKKQFSWAGIGESGSVSKTCE